MESQNLSMPLMVVVSLLIVICVNADPGCNDNSFEPGSATERNVKTVLGDMAAFTAGAPDYSYTTTVEAPYVFGSSSCSTDLSTDDCSSCISDAVNDLADACPFSVSGLNDQDDCRVFYNAP